MSDVTGVARVCNPLCCISGGSMLVAPARAPCRVQPGNNHGLLTAISSPWYGLIQIRNLTLI